MPGRIAGQETIHVAMGRGACRLDVLKGLLSCVSRERSQNEDEGRICQDTFFLVTELTYYRTTEQASYLFLCCTDSDSPICRELSAANPIINYATLLSRVRLQLSPKSAVLLERFAYMHNGVSCDELGQKCWGK